MSSLVDDCLGLWERVWRGPGCHGRGGEQRLPREGSLVRQAGVNLWSGDSWERGRQQRELGGAEREPVGRFPAAASAIRGLTQVGAARVNHTADLRRPGVEGRRKGKGGRSEARRGPADCTGAVHTRLHVTHTRGTHTRHTLLKQTFWGGVPMRSSAEYAAAGKPYSGTSLTNPF